MINGKASAENAAETGRSQHEQHSTGSKFLAINPSTYPPTMNNSRAWHPAVVQSVRRRRRRRRRNNNNKKKKQKKNKKGKWREDVFRMVFPSKHFAVGRLLALSAVTFHWIWWIHLMPSGCTVSFTLKGKKTRHLNRLIHWINQTPRRWVKIWKMNFIENTATNVLNALLRMQSIKLITFNDEIGFRYGKCAVSSNISLAIQRHLQVEISPLTSQLLCFHGFIFNSLRIPAWNVVNPTNSWIGA